MKYDEDNDLVLNSGEIPLRSDVSYKKIIKICQSLELMICNESFNSFRLYTPLVLLSRLIGDKAFPFFNPFLAGLIYSESLFKSILKNQFEIYLISVIKK
ncbi:MAG: hypothetical protein ACTSXY_15385 [Promethearchaeota archaeon]|nr:MAG: hypothetical protein DRQ57_01925 [Gammaproteobacteria bacterium]